MSRWRTAALALVLAGVGPLAACGSNQDPGIVPDDTSGGPGTTSHLLQPCPKAGSGDTIPEAGCLDGSGKVVH
jgi:hypothetical protein